jgi:hypothetical protein
MSKGSSFYPELRVVPANWTTREMDPKTKRYHDVPNPLKFLACFQRSEFGPRYTAKLPETPTWPIDLRLAIEAAAARRDAAVAKVVAP